MKPEKEKDVIDELSKSLLILTWWIGLYDKIIYIYRVVIKIMEPLVVAAFLTTVLFGIWSDNLNLLKISATILLSGGITVALFSLIANIDRIRKGKLKNSAVTTKLDKSASDHIIMSFIEDRFKNDEAYRKKISEIYLSSQNKKS